MHANGLEVPRVAPAGTFSLKRFRTELNGDRAWHRQANDKMSGKEFPVRGDRTVGVVDSSFSGLARRALEFMWPAMVTLTVGYAVWARRRRSTRPSRRVLFVVWLAAAASATILVALIVRAHQPSDADGWQSHWYMLVEMPLPASLAFAGLQLIALVRPRDGWFTVAIVALSALAAGLVSALWLLTAPLFLFLPFDRFSPKIWGLGLASVATTMGYAVALPLWLTALRKRTPDPLTDL